MNADSELGVVVIGRNEGKRLERCLASLQAQHQGPVVYVDSGSTDGSVEHAESIGVIVVELDMSRAFTMARARNAGLMYLTDQYPQCRLVQFIDGDCELARDWIARARSYLQEHQQVVAVCGNRRERFPNASLYNRLINLEWQGAAGKVDACGGDAMYRTDALLMVDGFNETMIAGEEAELCVRLTATGLSIVRLDLPMTTHDANMLKLSQWWLRSVRCGHAYAQGYDLQRKRDKSLHYKRRQMLSSLAYGAAFPCLFLIFASMLVSLQMPDQWVVIIYAAMLFLLSLYIRVIEKTARSRSAMGNTAAEIFLYAYFVALGKFPEAQGVIRYYRNKLFGRTANIIEYRRG